MKFRPGTLRGGSDRAASVTHLTSLRSRRPLQPCAESSSTSLGLPAFWQVPNNCASFRQTFTGYGLSSLIQREIIYRILRGAEGTRLRAIATLGDQSDRTAKAIAWIKANYAMPLRVKDLAEIAGMGVSTLHHHFRTLTAMSPLQYQKQLRLQAARGHMILDGLDAASARFEAGYESASQFNREYSRFFGQPPMRDIRTLHSPCDPSLESVSNR